MSDGDATLRKANAKVTGAQKVRGGLQRPSNKGFFNYHGRACALGAVAMIALLCWRRDYKGGESSSPTLSKRRRYWD